MHFYQFYFLLCFSRVRPKSIYTTYLYTQYMIDVKCNRCGKTWTPRKKISEIVMCPKCHSPYWNRKRIYNRKGD
jgi:predicted Zn-ribbon and HTH transcriptional regulator